MARPRKHHDANPIEETVQVVPETDSITATIEQANSTEEPATVQGKKIQPAAHLAAQKTGVYLRNKQTGKIISGPISEKVAKQQVAMWPNKIEITTDAQN